ncbi:MAG: hypothetical protein ABW006_11340 [Hyphomicrobium sp.]
MATILEFKSVPRPTAASVLAVCDASESAEIVFFPGVRYDRPADDGERKSATGRRHLEDPELES